MRTGGKNDQDVCIQANHKEVMKETRERYFKKLEDVFLVKDFEEI